MPNPPISQSLPEEEIAVKIFERFENAVKIKKPKGGERPEPTRITDEKGHVIAYPVIRNGNIEFSTERPENRESFDFKASYTQGASNVFKSSKLLGSGAYGHVKEATLVSQNKQNQ
ncbi:MAG: hypothetical protein NTW08_09975 [Gammaproteobacteria bacterium]|nr:hypothetical protein [Gammaproteobacteria bacterium]